MLRLGHLWFPATLHTTPGESGSPLLWGCPCDMVLSDRERPHREVLMVLDLELYCLGLNTGFAPH